MKNLRLVGVAFGVIGGLLAAAPASAADRPVYKAPPAEVWNWTGLYVGANIGYSWGRSKNDIRFFDNTTNLLLFATNRAFDLNGLIGGLQIGFNWQNGNWILGLEADIQASGQRGGMTVSCVVAICNPNADTAATDLVMSSLNQRLLWFGTLRGRLAVTLTPTVMAFITGGLAVGRIATDGTLAGFTAGGLPTASVFGNRVTKWGWTLGLGLEGWLTGNWTGKIEYIYLDLGTTTTTAFLLTSAPPLRVTFDSRVTDHILRIGINYHFNHGPIVTRY